jgi:hypothetical protein
MFARYIISFYVSILLDIFSIVDFRDFIVAVKQMNIILDSFSRHNADQCRIPKQVNSLPEIF